MKRFWIGVSGFCIGSFIIFLSFFADDAGLKAEGIIETKDSVVIVTVSFTGDLMCHSTQFNYARINKDSFDFRPVYDEILEYLRSPDFLVGNLETVTAGRQAGYSGYPFFNSPDDYIEALKYAGFDLLVTANNHSLDKSEKGLLRTIEQIKKNGINQTGTFTDQRDRDSIRITDLNGIKFAFLSYTYGTNGIAIPKGREYLVNIIDTRSIDTDIKAARERGAEIVIVYFHFGTEYKRLPDNFQKEVVNNTIASGADIIIGSHPHVIQPVEFFKTENARLDTGLTAYSLGNFISNQRWRYSDAGVILNITIAKNLSRDSLYIINADYIPTWVFRGEIKGGKQYRILPAERYDDPDFYFLTESDRVLMRQAFGDTKETMNKYSDRIRIYPAVESDEAQIIRNK